MQASSHNLSLVVAAVLAALSVLAQAQTTASSRFRVQGTITPAGAGRAANAAGSLYQIVAQPDPLGESRGSVGTTQHGWRLPAVATTLYHYALEAGWNLQGAPGVSDRTAGEIFTGPAGAPIKIGNLQYPSPTGSFVEAADSDPILGLQAFWVFSYWGGRGRTFDTPDAPTPEDGTAWQDLLEPGWNLFSPPYLVSVPPRGSIVVVWRWEPATAAYEVVLPGEEMHPLDGYWIFKLDEKS
jgi:hypothetical protein